MTRTLLLAVLGGALAGAPAPPARAETAATPATDYIVKARFRLGGEGGWDYLSYDAVGRRLFIARGNRVQVVDPRRGVVVGEIADTAGVHGVALAADLGKGYTSNGRDDSVTVFDLKTLAKRARIATTGGLNPDFIAYDAVTRRVVTFNGRSHNASVIDAVEDRLVATIELGGKPEAAVADGRGTLFVDIEDRDELVAIDLRRGAVEHRWPLAGCHEPAALALDARMRRLFVGCHNKTMLVVDADSGRAVAALPIGEGVDANAFDAVTRLTFSSQGDGTLAVVRQDSADAYTALATVATQRGARTMALDPGSHEIYLVSADFDDAPATPGQPRRRQRVKPDTFTLIVMAPGHAQ